MIKSNLLKAASKTWPFLYVFKLSTVSAFSHSTRTISSTFISESIVSTKTIPHQKWYHPSLSKPVFKTRHFSSSIDDFSISSEYGTTTSANFALKPDSDDARTITKSIGIDEEQHGKLVELSHLVVEWNERLNLISRRDCSPEVVFGRHILPSIALAALPQFQDVVNNSSNPRIVDVGTGGGFPGLPLSIIFPEAKFLLVDSVGKKLRAVDEMSSELGLENIATHHGRAEQITDDPIIGRRHKRKYDICVGRSVTAMPRFCFWIQDLLKKEEGKLVYIIGGEVEKSVQSRVDLDVPIDDLLKCEGASDKRTLVLSSNDVIAIAKESGEKKVVSRKRNSNKKKNNKARQNDDGKWNKSKGGWSERNNAEQKERGYSNFKRYESN